MNRAGTPAAPVAGASRTHRPEAGREPLVPGPPVTDDRHGRL